MTLATDFLDFSWTFLAVARNRAASRKPFEALAGAFHSELKRGSKARGLLDRNEQRGFDVVVKLATRPCRFASWAVQLCTIHSCRCIPLVESVAHLFNSQLPLPSRRVTLVNCRTNNHA
jgi:hypothetical protein